VASFYSEKMFNFHLSIGSKNALGAERQEGGGIHWWYLLTWVIIKR